MPVFYVNFHNGRERSLDTVGMEFESVEDAYLDAYASAQEIWCELLRKRQDPMRCAFEIADPNGLVLMVVPFSEILDNCRNRDAQPTAVRSALLADILTKVDRSLELRRELSSQFEVVNRTLSVTRSILARSGMRQ